MGPKAVYRLSGPDGRAAGDLLALADEPPPDAGEPLLETVMRGGELARPHPALTGSASGARRSSARCRKAFGASADTTRIQSVPSEALRARQEKAVAGARAR